MYLVDTLIALSRTNFWQKNSPFVLNGFKSLAEDQSWRVRYYLCEKLPEIGEATGKESYKKNFQAYHLKFLQDSEPEMKSVAALKVEKVIGYMDPDEILTKLLPLLKAIQSDQNGFVRSNSAPHGFRCLGVIGPLHVPDNRQKAHERAGSSNFLESAEGHGLRRANHAVQEAEFDNEHSRSGLPLAERDPRADGAGARQELANQSVDNRSAELLREGDRGGVPLGQGAKAAAGLVKR